MRLRSLIHPHGAEAELDEEIRFHIEERTTELMALGRSPDEARLEARREFGGVEQVKEEVRDAWGLGWLWSVLADLRYGWRVLWKAPGFTLVAVLSLAIGIGANTAIFSLADAVLLRRLPVPRPEGLVELIAVSPTHKQTNLPAEVYDHVRLDTESFEGLAASYGFRARLRVGNGPSEDARALAVSGSFFRMLGVLPSRGRPIVEEDDRPGAPRVAVISESLWERRFGRKAEILGETVWVRGVAVTIVGVAAAGFVGVDRSSRPDLILPLAAERQTSSLWIVGRLRPSVSREEATARSQPLFRRALESLREQTKRWPTRQSEEFFSQRLELAFAGTGTAALRWQLAQPLKVLAAAVLFVLLIAVTNVAALTLSRGDRRAREIAVRLALGASRGRVIRQLLVESTELAILGGVAGILLAQALHRILLSLSPLDPSAAVGFRLDGHVLGFTVAISALAGILTGIVPALRLTRVDLQPVLKGERGTLGRARTRTLQGILVAQVAATLVLLTAAGLFLRSLQGLFDVEMGFDRKSVLLARLAPVEGQDHVPTGLDERIVASLRGQPGIEAVAVAGRPTFGPGQPWILTAWVDGYEYAPDEDQWVHFNAVGPGFFRTCGTPLLAGRDFSARDARETPRAAIVNRSFVRRYFGGQKAVGRRLGTSGAKSSRDLEIVGVVADSKAMSVRERTLPALFLPLRVQDGFRSLTVHVRTAGQSAGQLETVRRVLKRAGTGLELRRLTTIEERVAESLRRDHMFAKLTALFGVMALFLTAVGLYGTMAHAAARRTHEIGIRQTLGASRRSVAWLMLKNALLVVGLGVAIGLPAAAGVGRGLRSVLFGLGAPDPVALLGAVVLMAGVGALAALLPAHQAAARNPLDALRHE